VFSILWYPYEMVFQVIHGMSSSPNTHAAFITSYSSTWQVIYFHFRVNCFHPASKLAGIQQEFL
jgi:hypothetical protein